MAKNFSFHRIGLVFWILSLIVFTLGLMTIPASAVQSVALILTAITNFVLGGLSIVYADLTKKAK